MDRNPLPLTITLDLTGNMDKVIQFDLTNLRKPYAHMTLFVKVFTTRTLVQIILVLSAAFSMKALSIHYDFNWAAALAG